MSMSHKPPWYLREKMPSPPPPRRQVDTARDEIFAYLLATTQRIKPDAKCRRTKKTSNPDGWGGMLHTAGIRSSPPWARDRIGWCSTRNRRHARCCALCMAARLAQWTTAYSATAAAGPVPRVGPHAPLFGLKRGIGLRFGRHPAQHPPIP